MAGALREVRHFWPQRDLRCSVACRMATKTSMFLKSYHLRALCPQYFTIRPLAPSGKLNNHRFFYHWGEVFSETHHPWHDVFGQPEIHRNDVIVLMMDDPVEQRNQFRMPLSV